eukprot:m.40566 g.40566  ORF g.40566 m.40566 type:complete len:50 (+) comp18535_c0_seq1:2201-2350(+)
MRDTERIVQDNIMPTVLSGDSDCTIDWIRNSEFESHNPNLHTQHRNTCW